MIPELLRTIIIFLDIRDKPTDSTYMSKKYKEKRTYADRKEYMRKWRKANAVRLNAIRRTKHKANPENKRISDAKYYVTHRAEIKAYRKKNASVISVKRKIRYQKNKTAEYKQIKKYRKAHPEVHRSESQRRRALLRNATVEVFQDIDIYNRDNWICGICGEKVDKRFKGRNPKAVSLDHIKPLTKGGNHTMENCQCSHFGCNSSKNAQYDVREKPA